MRTQRRTIAATMAVMLTAVWTGQVRGDFVFSEPKNLGPTVNCELCEYDPSLSPDGLELYYSSCRTGTYGVQDLWVLRRPSIDAPWSKPQNLGSTINSAAQELGPSLSADGLTMYFSCIREEDGIGGHDVYMTTRAGREEPWGPPVMLDSGINTQFDDVSPWISADGKTLFLCDAEWGSAVRPGGRGQCDIWMATRADAESPWGSPINVSAVNSTAVDGAPSVSTDGLVLLFGSNRAGGLGQWDIWVSVRKTANDKWRHPVNLGASVNSGSWDGNPALSPDGRTLYFSSDRPGGRGYTDLWEASISPIVDLNGDGKVDEAEVRIMTESLGKDDPLCDIGPTPFGDGIVDMKDLAVLTQCAAQEFHDPTLTVCWKFDEAEGIVASECTQACDGMLVGGPVWQPEEGAVGGAIQLDGVDDHITTRYVCDPSREPISIFAWVKGGAPGQAIISQKMGANWLIVDAATGALASELRSDSRFGRNIVSKAVITDGKWHRVGLVLDGAGRTLYVDGVLVAQDTQNQVTSAYGGLHIGTGKDLTAGSFWSGLIDDVRIYNRIVKP